MELLDLLLQKIEVGARGQRDDLEFIGQMAGNL
jgi:hypothetical protein